MSTHSARNRVPNHLELMNPTLRVLRALGGRASIDEILQEVKRDLDLAQDIVATLHLNGPRTELEYRLAWTRTYLKRYGLVENTSRGVWSLTELGLRTETVEASGVQVRFQGGNREVPSTQPEASVTIGSTGHSSAALDWREELLNKLKTITPPAFERLCKQLLEKSGLSEVCVTGRSGDGGIDGHGVIQLSGLMRVPVLFQCKRFSTNVSPGVVREFRGAMHGRADRGMIFTTGGFTSDARHEANRTSPTIELIDGQLLTEKLKELGLGVSTRIVEEVEIDSKWFDSI